MDETSERCLINSISRFIHLVSCQTIKLKPIQKDYKTMAGALKLLKPLLDEVVDYKIPLDEVLNKECEELDMVVNEAREFMENWSPKMSKIFSVLHSEPLMMKIQSSSLEICHILYRLLQSSPSNSSMSAVQHCMQEIHCLKQERIMEHITKAMRGLQDDTIRCTDHLVKIIESLGLTSNQELLKESLAVEMERIRAERNQNKGHSDQMNYIVDLISHIRDCMLKIERFEATSGVPIPPYFRCPLSLELMIDPVIVASGQTYERVFIQKWLDHGLNICPKTRQTLAHTNLIPNYTVKAMIENWCEENNLRLPSYSVHNNIVSVLSPLDHVSAQDLIRTDSFRSLRGSNSTSRSSVDVGNGFQKLKIDVSSRLTEKSNHPSPEQSYIHSRSESASSAISSVEYMLPASKELSRRCSKNEKSSELSGEIISECPAASPSRSDEVTTTPYVKKLIEDLNSTSNEIQASAAAELRLLAKHNMENRMIIGNCGAIPPLLSLLYSEAQLTQEHAVTALLNLSINDENKAMIAEAGAIEPLIHVLKSGNGGAKENSAAALFSLSVLEEYKAKIGRSGAVKALVDLLGSGTLRGRKDAATALFNLSIFHENKARIIQAGAVKHLVDLMDPSTGMVDKAVALLANLSTVGEGRLAIAREGGIPSLVEVVESGSQRGKENAASILLQLCLHSPKFCTLVLQEGAVPPLVGLSQSGTPRAKEKAQQLLSHFRNQREGSTGKKKS
ncbi:U-box domain-containing protein 3 [Citrus sinensis]|uniref:U-box domain-containing protein 3 n=1 Tax=Citrus sinensis TaxID=2711 RepID=A0ACB8MIY8_CITSI|nr:U-box domain-containing protein 3 isoform X2 [Citrus x clementina]KAH9785390.1 U-box domain-containing protein 3 [Citrus sinensis]